MSDFPTHIRLVGLRNPVKVEAHLSSRFIDIADATDTSSASVDFFVEEADGKTNWPTDEDREWLIRLFRQLLDECGETEAEIVFLAGPTSQSDAA